MDNVNAAAKSAAQTGGTVSTNANTQAKPVKKIEVDDFLITGAKVHVDLTALGGKEMTLVAAADSSDGFGPKAAMASPPAELTRTRAEAPSPPPPSRPSASAGISKGAESLGKDADKAAGAGVNKVINKGLGGLLGK